MVCSALGQLGRPKMWILAKRRANFSWRPGRTRAWQRWQLPTKRSPFSGFQQHAPVSGYCLSLCNHSQPPAPATSIPLLPAKTPCWSVRADANTDMCSLKGRKLTGPAFVGDEYEVGAVSHHHKDATVVTPTSLKAHSQCDKIIIKDGTQSLFSIKNGTQSLCK